MIRYKNFVRYIIKVTVIIFLSDGMDGIYLGNYEILVIFEKDNYN